MYVKSTKSCAGIYLNLHIEDQSNHLWVDKNPQTFIGIDADKFMKIHFTLC